jgi:excinuclease UvrABC nuclease subunit
LEKTLERQVTVTTDFMDRDVVGVSGSSDFRLVSVMTIRRGFLRGVRHFELIHAAPEKGELMAQFLGSITRMRTPFRLRCWFPTCRKITASWRIPCPNGDHDA